MSRSDKHNAFAVAAKLVPILKKDREIWSDTLVLGVRGDKLTTLNFTNMSFNHLFDDFPEKFGITKQEAHDLRGYLHNVTFGDNEKNLIYWKGFFALLDMED